jgi:hypothetical protein
MKLISNFFQNKQKKKATKRPAEKEEETDETEPEKQKKKATKRPAEKEEETDETEPENIGSCKSNYHMIMTTMAPKIIK